MKASTVQRPPKTDAPADRRRERSKASRATELLRRAYRTMLLSRRIDDKEIQLKNQSLIFFQISGAGHEAMLVAAGMHLQAGYDWFYPVLSRSRALPALGMTPLEMLLAAVGAEGRPELRRPADAVALGHTRAQHSVAEQPDRHAGVCTRSAAPRPASIYERVTDIPDREERFHADEVTYVSIGDGATSEGEFWESLNTACTRSAAGALSRRRQRLRDLGAGRSADPRRRHLAARRDVSRPESAALRRHRLPRELPRRCARRSRTARASASPALVHAKVIRPYSHSLSDDERLYKTPEEREAEAQRDPLTRMRDVPARRGSSPPTPSSTRSPPTSIARSPKRPTTALGRAEAVDRHRRLLRVLARRRSDVGARSRRRPQPDGQARHDGRGHQPHAERRDGAQPAHRHLRRGRRRRQPRRGAAAGARARAACSR